MNRDLNLTWTEHPDDRVGPRLECVASTWEGTRCDYGEALKGTRANCATFVWAIVAELCRMPAPPFEIDMRSVLHHRKPGLLAIRKLRLTYPMTRVRDGSAMPGDIIVAGLTHGGPSHVMVVGSTKNTVWHCTHHGVCRGGWVLPGNSRLMKVYRPDSDRWFR